MILRHLGQHAASLDLGQLTLVFEGGRVVALTDTRARQAWVAERCVGSKVVGRHIENLTRGYLKTHLVRSVGAVEVKAAALLREAYVH